MAVVGRILIALVGIGLGVWLVAPVWGPEPVPGVDVVAHLTRVEFGIRHLVAHGRLDGWYPRGYLGHHNFGIRGPGVTWMTAMVQALGFGHLTTTQAFNAVILASFAILPITVAFAARALGLDATAAGIAGLLALTVSNPVGNGIEGMFGLGLVENQVASSVVFLALGTLLRVTRSPHPRAILAASVAVACVALTHTPTTIVFVPLAAVYLLHAVLTSGHPLRAMARLALVGLLVVGLTAFWLIPLVTHRDLVGISAPTPPGRGFVDAINALAAGEFLLPGRLPSLVLVGWAFVLLRAVRGDASTLILVVGPAAYFLIAYGLASVLPFQLGWQAQTRGLGYAAILSTFPLATLFTAVVQPLGALGRIVAVAGATALAVVSIAPLRTAHVRPYMSAPACLAGAAAELARLVPAQARFATRDDLYYAQNSIGSSYREDDADRTLFPGIERWLVWRSGRNGLSGLTIDSSSVPWFASEETMLGQVPAAEWADRIARIGITHVVAPNADYAAMLNASGRFVPRWSCGPLTILALRARQDHPHPDSLLGATAGIRARVLSSEPEHVRIAVRTTESRRTTIALPWSPRWQVSLDGSPVPFLRTVDGLIEVPVAPPGGILDVRYGLDRWDRMGRLVTLATLVLLVATVAWRLAVRAR
jgi:hypothetical protein